MRLFLASFAKLHDYVGIKNSFSFLKGKWVEKRNLHLTYLFLGEVATPVPLKKQLQQITYEHKRVPIQGIGFFGTPAKILYAKAYDEEIIKLHHKILEVLQKEDDKPFLPHITLCRIKELKNFEKFLHTIRKYEHKNLGFLELELHLIESHLTPKGPIYKSIHTF
ncbi:RNA 2',3'-cyclic phosphodiesterase [Nitratiruptor tergarcus]|uniref:2'-5' RNA ligase n=1 Tax=Nitratiruptor tergarcus DSM 16512 TaxID=1069081 RepID=A0A1W1WQD7_9BACT|nr:RNA 2',3'-cyclic phosphodiesterase [Nitratiruptor tergarcus]SMC08429.1 2'-5' RNA ligase [Nitratiruptor tergarcus DSM 16512]